MMTRRNEDHTVEEAVERAIAAVRHTDSDVIQAIHVVPGRRPTFDELQHLRQKAGSLMMTVAGDGSVSVRRPPAPDLTVNRTPTKLRVTHVVGRCHIPHLSMGFAGLKEGVR